MERILYTKYSNERTAQFAIRTDIVEKDGSRQVRKKAYYEAGNLISGKYMKLMNS